MTDATLTPGAASSDVALPYGHTAASVDRLARQAAAGGVAEWLDRGDAYEVAWFVIVERLYIATSRPSPGQLVTRARTALLAEFRDQRAEHGTAVRTGRQAASANTGFRNYWSWFARSTPSPEGRIVERLALEQIWPRLTWRDQETLTALTVLGEHQAAAVSLGLKRSTYGQRMTTARRRFLALWHEGEAPSGQWRRDARTTDAYRTARADGLRCRGNPAAEYWRRRVSDEGPMTRVRRNGRWHWVPVSAIESQEATA